MYKGEKLESEELNLRIGYGDSMSVFLIEGFGSYCFNDEVWQYGYFSFGDISTLTSEPVTLEVYYEDEEEHVVYSETANLVVGDSSSDFEPLGFRINEAYDGEQIQIDYILFNGGFMYFDGMLYDGGDVYLKFVDSESNEYRTTSFDVGSIYYAGSIMATPLDATADEAIRSGREFDIYFVYTDNMGIEHEVLCYTNFSFTYS